MLQHFLIVLAVCGISYSAHANPPEDTAQESAAASSSPSGSVADTAADGTMEATTDDGDAALAVPIPETAESASAAFLTAAKRRLSWYGFVEALAQKYTIADDSELRGIINERINFMVSNVNLFFRSDLSRSFSTIAELRFSHYPHGLEKSVEFQAFDIPYDREETGVPGHFSTSPQYRLGGVSIERANGTWKINDQLAFTFGRYFTPYGIWNVDHGGPVLIPSAEPFMQTTQVIPQAQTGLQVFGSLPFDSAIFDYALTVSNGRGSMDETADWDNNKALGLRLRGSLDTADFGAVLGAYGYMGRYSDFMHRMKLGDAGAEFEEVITESYDELAGSVDLTLKYSNVTFMSEWVLNKASVRIKRAPGPAGSPAPKTSQTILSGYALLGYDVAPHFSEDAYWSLTPYFMYQYNRKGRISRGNVYMAGINYKPDPFVAFKLEHTVVDAVKNRGSDLQATRFQAAFAF
jgi:hypothetical protein